MNNETQHPNYLIIILLLLALFLLNACGQELPECQTEATASAQQVCSEYSQTYQCIRYEAPIQECVCSGFKCTGQCDFGELVKEPVNEDIKQETLCVERI